MRGKIVRKLAAAGLSAVVAVSASVPVFAADKSYSISEIGDMNISLPEDITVIDRNAPDSAEYFKLFGLDYNTVMSQMDSNNVYLQGMDSTASLTVTVSMTESADSQELENYNLLSSEQLGDIARNFLSQPEYTACRIDEAGKPVTWLSFDTNVGGVKAYLATGASTSPSSARARTLPTTTTISSPPRYRASASAQRTFYRNTGSASR